MDYRQRDDDDEDGNYYYPTQRGGARSDRTPVEKYVSKKASQLLQDQAPNININDLLGVAQVLAGGADTAQSATALINKILEGYVSWKWLNRFVLPVFLIVCVLCSMLAVEYVWPGIKNMIQK